MKKDYLTIVIQPERKSNSKKVSRTVTFEVPHRIFYYLLVVAVLLVAFGVRGVDSLSKNVSYHQKARLLESSLAHLRTIDSRVAVISKETRIIRAFLGLDETGGDLEAAERLGQGGYASDQTIPPEQLDTRQELIDSTDSQPLLNRVTELQDDLHELIETLSKMNTQLNRRPTIMPVKDGNIWITSGFGWRRSPFTGLRDFHNGIDISGRRGAPIIATADGTVTEAGKDRYLGYYVTVRHDKRFITRYGHMLKNLAVKAGDTVRRGDVLGYMGSTGLSTGYHLHYIVSDNGKDINPYNYILNRTETALAPGLNVIGSDEG